MSAGSGGKGVIAVIDSHPAMTRIAEHFHGPVDLGLHAFQTLPFALALAGVLCAWFLYRVSPDLPPKIHARFTGLHRLLENKYYLDRFNEIVFAGGARFIGGALWKRGDQELIDGVAVNGSARVVGGFASLLRLAQTGRLNTYAITMIVGVAMLLMFVVLPMLAR